MDDLKRQEKNGGAGDLFSRIQAEHLVLSSSVVVICSTACPAPHSNSRRFPVEDGSESDSNLS